MSDNKLALRIADVQIEARSLHVAELREPRTWRTVEPEPCCRGAAETVESHPCSSLGCGRRASWPKQPKQNVDPSPNPDAITLAKP